ncbi:FAD-binding oxidoreductase [Natronoglycomyces albus]|uniref:FAD-binding oxidoreductase n=1 Tax=Natronoglycomyces albus TaxID=2811108 RepID=A0A895XWN0_9ACTN|nr:FAD-binding oxidoreductase [Natronoglycomyces albus]QSB06916.1 FAD-binding oxidoreductase [Natronoglycomyces albus]
MTPYATLETVLRQQLLPPGSPGYATATETFFASPGRVPLAAVRPTSAEEVAVVVRETHHHGVPLTVRSGGHTPRAIADGSVTLDTRKLNALHMDPKGRIGTAGGGVLAGDYNAAAHQHELSTGFGDSPTVGIAGLTLGGGLGFLSRRDGLTIDNLRSADLVLADGSLVTASHEEHPELFWALRGGGGNFGVVTQLRYDLRPAGTITGGLLGFNADPDLLVAVTAAVAAAPRELGAMLNLMIVPPIPWIPEEIHGTLALMLFLCHSGSARDAEKVFAGLRALGQPIIDTVTQKPYPEMVEGPPAAPEKPRVAVSSGFISSIDRAWAASAIDAVETSAIELASIQLRFMGGAIAEVPPQGTAFAYRHHQASVAVVAGTYDPAKADEGAAWATRARSALGLTGLYGNFLGDRLTGDDVTNAFPGETLPRLREVKRRYDPDNVFFSNLNIDPA